jgi:microsomal dipeptidase-like Zn-dependent dipeptidase
MKRLLPMLVLLVGCPKEAEAPKQIDVAKWLDCPEGSTYDANKKICVANPVVEEKKTEDAGAPIPIPIAAAPDAGTEPVTTASGNVIVRCDFPEGWVTLLPVAAYPKDDSFLMQSLIGLTEDPKFWIGAGYAKLSAWKAKKCPKTGAGFTISSGDYWILAGQANTFGTKGKYDKNGFRKKQTFAVGSGSIIIDLKAADLTFTWLCISCPWIVAPGVEPFTALRDRDEKKKHGTDTIPLRGLVVENHRVRIRVAERERETTFLDSMALVKDGKRFLPTARALHADDGFDVHMDRGTEIAVEFEVDVDGSGDYALEITGHYEPEERPWIVDLHVDLPWSASSKRDLSEVSDDRLRRGNVRTLITPLFVENAFQMKPAQVREAYDADLRALEAAKPAALTRIAFEGADGFADDPKGIDPWIAKGACFVGLVHSRSNALAGSATDPAKKTGLTEAGKSLAKHVLEAGGLLDVAHASDAAFDDLAAISNAAHKPIVDTHTGMRAIVAIDRNLSDEHAAIIAASGGVIGLSMHSGHVTPRSGETATLEEYVAQIEHAAKLMGFDHVAIGSDLAGAIRPPSGSDGAATWPILAGLLHDRGWSDAQIHALFHGNAERVLRACQPQMQ